ncbi:MAG: aquaporin [Pseudomonadota bacterium]
MKWIAELIGTFTLVLLGCGAAVLAGDVIGVAGIAFAFGFALIAMAYGIGPVSGCHINPAVSLAAFTAGRMPAGEMVGYIVAQCIGALLGALVLMLIANGQMAGYDAATSGLGQNGWGEGYNGEFTGSVAFLFEFVATALFVIVILGATQKQGAGQVAGLAIGLALVVIHLVGIQITGTSVNPARSLGPAVVVGGEAMAQLWLFIAAPLAGGVVGGGLFRLGVVSASDDE